MFLVFLARFGIWPFGARLTDLDVSSVQTPENGMGNNGFKMKKSVGASYGEFLGQKLQIFFLLAFLVPFRPFWTDLEVSSV